MAERDEQWLAISVRVRELLIEQLRLDKPGTRRPKGLTVDDIPLDTNLTDDPVNADSLDLVESVMAFEDTFEITIPSEDEGNLSTVAKITDYIIKKGYKLD